jgi:hypothetical protein
VLGPLNSLFCFFTRPIDPRPYNYTLRTNYRNMECAVGRLTIGIRRVYLTNVNVWHRNAVGPWNRVLQVSTHVTNTMGTVLLRSMRRTVADAPFDLMLAYILGVKSLLTQPGPGSARTILLFRIISARPPKQHLFFFSRGLGWRMH